MGDDAEHTGHGRGGAARAVDEEFFENGQFGGGEFAREFGDVDNFGGDGADPQPAGDEVLLELLQTKKGEGR